MSVDWTWLLIGLLIGVVAGGTIRSKVPGASKLPGS